MVGSCFYCGGKLVWCGQNTLEELGIEGEGVADRLICSDCGSYAYFYLEDEEDGEA